MPMPPDGPNPRGDPARHLPGSELERRFAALPAPPRDRGALAFIVARAEDHQRTTPGSVRLTPEEGVPGDRWKSTDGRPESQLAVIRKDVAELLANGQSLTLFGDNLVLDLDLSTANLPTGSRLRCGEALLEVTPEPHNGCAQFRQRFGADALRLTANPAARDQHLRGIYLRVVEPGKVTVGDAVEVVSRA